MFPFEENNEYISSQNISSDPHQDMAQILMDHSGQPTNFTNLMSTQEPVDQLLQNNNTISNSIVINDEKKMIRKELERKRRQQMSTLHASLRSLHPLQSIKGKRSMSDHLNEAAKYIKHLQNNVEKLRMKRDKLKSFWDSSPVDEQSKCSHNNYSLTNTTVTVRSHVFGVEIMISCGCKEENFLLSRVLEALVEEGFDVFSSISTKTDTRLYHTIQCQASNISCVDLAVLQQKLNIAIS